MSTITDYAPKQAMPTRNLSFALTCMRLDMGADINVERVSEMMEARAELDGERIYSVRDDAPELSGLDMCDVCHYRVEETELVISHGKAICSQCYAYA